MKLAVIILLLLGATFAENIYKDTKYAIVTVSKSNWDSQVMAKRNIGHVVIAHFYKASDGKSKTFRDSFNEEAKKNKGIFQFVGIDCDADSQLCTKEDITKFPALKVYPPIPIPAQAADHELDIKQALKISANFLTSKVQEITDDNYQQKVGENPAVPKVLLFTNKPGTPILYKAISLAFDVEQWFTIEKTHDWYRETREQGCVP